MRGTGGSWATWRAPEGVGGTEDTEMWRALGTWRMWELLGDIGGMEMLETGRHGGMEGTGDVGTWVLLRDTMGMGNAGDMEGIGDMEDIGNMRPWGHRAMEIRGQWGHGGHWGRGDMGAVEGHSEHGGSGGHWGHGDMGVVEGHVGHGGNGRHERAMGMLGMQKPWGTLGTWGHLVPPVP